MIQWSEMVAKEQCSVIWQDDMVGILILYIENIKIIKLLLVLLNLYFYFQLCRYFVSGGFINWVNSWRERMGGRRWCEAYSMCSQKNRAFFTELEPMADSCSDCKNFFGNYLDIAKSDRAHFHEIFLQVKWSSVFYFAIFLKYNQIFKTYNQIYQRWEKMFATILISKKGAYGKWPILELKIWSSKNFLKFLDQMISAKLCPSATNFSDRKNKHGL